MGNNHGHANKIHLVQIGPNFWNVRASFKYSPVIDIGTHMSIIKLTNGKYLVIDTVPLNDGLKQELDALVGQIGGGTNIEAVVATHPFHTLSFPAFYKAYPDIPYYGTPRHLRKMGDIPWVGDISKNLNKWETDVFMRIPEGSEFIAPVPEDTNHFSCVWVFHPESKTIHVDDTVMYWSNPDALLKIGGKKKGLMELHRSVSGPGLLPHADAPDYFKQWALAVINDWDFDNLVCAHTGNKIGGAKEAFKECLDNSDATFDHLKHHHTKRGRKTGPRGGVTNITNTNTNTNNSNSSNSSGNNSNTNTDEKVGDPETYEECSKYIVEGVECG